MKTRITHTIDRLSQRPTAVKVVAGALTVGALVAIASSVRTQPVRAEPDASPFVQAAQRIVGPDAFAGSCNECHKIESRSWAMTAHQQSFDTMHTTEAAKAIAEKMGERSIKRSELCASCHYTTKFDRRPKPMWGVSCESCHGGARDFVDLHPHVAGDITLRSMQPGHSKEKETDEQRRARLKLAAQHGMVHTGMVYAMARTCVECHLVPNAKLVDVGGHPTDEDFEIVAWMNGSVRHNFVSSEDGKTNMPMSAERKRLFYVVGTMVDLEVTIKCFEMTKNPGPFKDAMVRRANRLIDRIDAIRAVTPLDAFDEVLGQLPPRFTPEAHVVAGLSEKLGEVTRTFADAHDGSELHKIDALLPDETHTVGQPYGPVP